MLRAVASEILSGTWANKPSSAAQGAIYFATDVGDHGTPFQYGVSRWRPINGVATLASKGAAQSGVAAVETIVLQSLIPVGAWQTNDILRVTSSLTKSGTTDTLQYAIRVGAAGTTADTALAAGTFVAAGNVTAGLMLDFKLASATSVQRVGTQGATSAYGGGSSTAIASPVTITDASANALYVSVSIASSGATNTVAMQSGQIQLITP